MANIAVNQITGGFNLRVAARFDAPGNNMIGGFNLRVSARFDSPGNAFLSASTTTPISVPGRFSIPSLPYGNITPGTVPGSSQYIEV